MTSQVSISFCAFSLALSLFFDCAPVVLGCTRCSAGVPFNARLMNAFIDSEEQREVSSLFNATIHLETPEEQNRAFSDAVLRIRDESLKEKNKTLDPADMKGLQELVKAKKDLEDLRRKRQQLHISFE